MPPGPSRFAGLQPAPVLDDNADRLESPPALPIRAKEKMSRDLGGGDVTDRTVDSRCRLNGQQKQTFRQSWRLSRARLPKVVPDPAAIELVDF
jgi:hypothetical protein